PVRASRRAIAAMATGQSDSLNVIAGPQPALAQAGSGNVDVVTASPVPAGADECLTGAGVDDSGHRERGPATVNGGARRGRRLAGDGCCHQGILSGDWRTPAARRRLHMTCGASRRPAGQPTPLGTSAETELRDGSEKILDARPGLSPGGGVSW